MHCGFDARPNCISSPDISVKSDGQSRRSLQSGPSTITKDSTFHSEDSKFELYSMNKVGKSPLRCTKTHCFFSGTSAGNQAQYDASYSV